MNLSWTDGGANTAYYEIFRQDYMGGNSPYQTILNPRATISSPDSGIIPDTNYTYKIDAIGFLGNRVGQGWQPQKRALNCSPPGPFTLNEPTNTFCQGSYPRADNLSWTPSSKATSYDLIRSLSNPITFSGITSTSFTDWGFGNALSFNGVNNNVTIGPSASLDIAGNLTITGWVYLNTANPTSKCIFEKINNFNLWFAGAGNLRFADDPGNYLDTVKNTWNAGQWYHLAGVYNGSIATSKIFVNGVSVAVTRGGTWNPLSGGSSTIGSMGSSNYFNGLIDEVRVYNRALSDSEVNNQYKGIYNDSGLVGLWHFDEGSHGTTISDSSNYGNNGTINGASWVQNGLQWQSQYKWQAKANGPGGSTLSNTTNSYAMPICLPTKPGLVLSSFCSTGLVNMTLRWSYTTKTIRYEIYRQGTGLIKTINQGDPEFSPRVWTDTNNGIGLGEQTNYTYYVKAIGPTSLENQSDSISNITPTCLVSPAPENLTATFVCCSSAGGSTCGLPASYYYPRINLSWDASAGATYYSIYRKVGTGSYSFLTTTSLTSYSNIYSSVAVDTSYSYYVVAYGSGGASLPSAEVSTTTGYCLPSTPSISSITTICESNSPANTISWSDSTSFNVFTYEIYRNTINTIPGTPIQTIASTTPEFTSRTWKDSSGLVALTQYYYWVRAVGPIGNKTSSSGSITTLGCGIVPAAPTLNLNNLYCQDNKPYVYSFLE